MPLQPTNYLRAAFFALAGFCGWSISDALLKLLKTEGVPQGQILFLTCLSGVTVVLLIALFRGQIGGLKPQPHYWRGLAAMSLCRWITFTCWVEALPHLPLTNMYAIAFITPMAVASMAALFLKEHLGWQRGLAIAAGFIGVVIAINPLSLIDNKGTMFSYMLVFVSMICTATQMLLLRVVSKHASSECTSFYPGLVLLIIGAFSCVTEGFSAMTGFAFGIACASGILSGLGWAFMSQAYKNAPAAAVAPFHYSQMITGAILGYLIWGNIPGPWLIAGTSIIIASGVYLVRHERRASRTMMRAT